MENITFDPYQVKFFTETIHLMPRLNINKETNELLSNVLYEKEKHLNFQNKYQDFKNLLLTTDLKEHLKEYNLNISNDLNNLIKDNIDILIETEIKVDKTRNSINDVLLTTAYLENIRTNENILITADNNGFITNVFYGNEYKEESVKNFIDKNNKVFFIGDNKQISYENGILINDKTSIVEEIYSKYKEKKYPIKLKYNEMNSTDIQLTLGYLWSTRTEISTTSIGCVVYDKNDRLITDGYNALKFEYKSDILKLMMHNTSLFSKIKDMDKKQRLISEIYALREKINDHAEGNAFNNIKRQNKDIKGGTIYLNFHPCQECTKKIVENGIKEIVIDENYLGNSLKEQKNWATSIQEATKMLNENNILLTKYDYQFSSTTEFTISKKEFIEKSENIIIKNFIEDNIEYNKKQGNLINLFISTYFIGINGEDNSIFRKYYNNNKDQNVFINESEFTNNLQQVLKLDINENDLIISNEQKENFIKKLQLNYNTLKLLPVFKEKYPNEISLSHMWNEVYGRLTKMKTTLDILKVDINNNLEKWFQEFINKLSKYNNIETEKDVENFSLKIQEISKTFNELKTIIKLISKEFTDKNINEENLNLEIINFLNHLNTIDYPLINEEIYKEILIKNDPQILIDEIKNFNKLIAQNISTMGSDYYFRVKNSLLSNEMLFDNKNQINGRKRTTNSKQVIEKKVNIENLLFECDENIKKGNKRIFFNTTKNFPKLSNSMQTLLMNCKTNIGIQEQLFNNYTKTKILELIGNFEPKYITSSKQDKFNSLLKETGFDETKIKELKKEIVILTIAEKIYENDKNGSYNTNTLQLQQLFNKELEKISNYENEFTNIYLETKGKADNDKKNEIKFKNKQTLETLLK